MKTLIGNTYEHREIIKKNGGKWFPSSSSWQVPDNVYEELQKLCSSKSANRPTSNYSCKRKFECHDCGDDVWPGTECWETGLIHRV